jgi:hypothetical protein
MRCFGRREDACGVAGKIADRAIDLRNGDL